MSEQYQVLARKYRPKNFDELLGQTHVSQALANAIDTGRLHHAYLFTGTRGVGKTTIARILAKCLNCETGITSKPCGVCDTCQSIDQGRFLDLIEIDAASRTKVEDTRDLLENVPYAPVQGRYKVYLIDEVHMLSTHSFNALLKTLEEPPEHVKFLFATTDPQKLPITIISRCLQFVLRPMPQALIAEHLTKILTSESISFSETAVWQLAHAAKGSVRDSLSLTDQAIAFGGGRISDQTVTEMLGLVDSTDIISLISAIHQDDRQTVAREIGTMRAKMVDAPAIFDRLIDNIHQMAMLQLLPQMPLDMNDAEAKRLMVLADLISGDVLQLYYEILIKSRDGIRLASTPMQALEMAILRLLAFRPLSNDQIMVHDTASTDDAAVHMAPNSALADLQTGDDALADELSAVPSISDTRSDIDSDDIDGASQLATIDSYSSDMPKATLLKQENRSNLPADDDHTEAANEIDLDVGTSLDLVNGDFGQDPASDRYNHKPDGSQESANLDQFNQDYENQILDIRAYDNDVVDTSSLQRADGSIDNAPKAEPSMAADDTNDANIHEELEQIEAEPSLAVMAAEHQEAAEALAEADFTEVMTDNGQITAADLAADDVGDNTSTTDDTGAEPALTTPAQMLDRLKPRPAKLKGAWDIHKWDYWLHLARIDGYFSADELALMAGSVMSGDIDGISQLHIAEQNSQIQSSFEGVAQKISAHYPELTLAAEPIVDQNLTLVPRQMLEERQQKLRIDAENQLINSPVFQRLWQQGYIVDDGSPVLTNTKLSID